MSLLIIYYTVQFLCGFRANLSSSMKSHAESFFSSSLPCSPEPASGAAADLQVPERRRVRRVGGHALRLRHRLLRHALRERGAARPHLRRVEQGGRHRARLPHRHRRAHVGRTLHLLQEESGDCVSKEYTRSLD